MTEPAPDDARAVRLRWIARAVVAAIGLWFLAEGIAGVWGGAGLVVLAVVVVALAVGALSLTRRGR
ncbi:hypothetical protein [Blastococcus haudaquaticus]|uniref:Uncharacterized protein n=1 Tax=Blastococcus haudaquaticus TaxID=1938745 RepID=A0A286GZT6_9ACTN|nr:hypothetical protein [Blastococcus haudaquaticus]SOE01011.1 hypothetical protein SAMN06272739_2912 [Blastococcus haudaquaticus]